MLYAMRLPTPASSPARLMVGGHGVFAFFPWVIAMIVVSRDNAETRMNGRQGSKFMTQDTKWSNLSQVRAVENFTARLVLRRDGLSKGRVG
jgi:hypothetical protein